VLLGGRAGYERLEREDLLRLAAGLGIASDVAIGSVEPEEMPEAMASAAVVVCATRTYEGFGLPAAEAAASAKPVVATRVGALPEVVLHGVTGLIVPPSDPRALANAIEAIVGDPAQAMAMGAAARASARSRFGLLDRVADQAAAYRSVMAAA
jgi:glycosyltransferase involved in cell wall biosynthesis